MSLLYPEASTASGGEITLRSYLGQADTSVRLVFVSSSLETLSEARSRVRRFDIAEWTNMVERFAENSRELDVDAEVWASAEPELLVTVVTPRDDLDHELALHAIFVDSVRNLDDPALGGLVIRTPDDARAHELNLGQRLR
jgi:hypothetical protein